MLALTGPVAVPSHAQQAGTGLAGSSNPSAASPYIQQRSQANTSFDNPYAPGGIYDPYRSSRMLPGGQNLGLQSKSKSAGLGGSSGSGLSSRSSLNSGSDDSSNAKARSGGAGQCGGKSFGSGSLASSGSGMNRPGGASLYSSSSRCRGLAGYGSSRSGAASSMSGMGRSSGSMSSSSLSGRQGMNSPGQAASMEQQRMQKLQQLPQ